MEGVANHLCGVNIYLGYWPLPIFFNRSGWPTKGAKEYMVTSVYGIYFGVGYWFSAEE